MKIKKSLFFLSSLVIFSCSNKESKQDFEKQNIQSKSISKSSDWALPNLTNEEKDNLIFAVKTVFNDFYVNRLQKITDYKYDALKEANKLNNQMSSEVLLSESMKIFRNIRDLHTGFIYPIPARCNSSSFPLSTKLIYDEYGENEKLIITQKYDKATFENETLNNNYNKLNIGDEILSIKNIGLEGISSSKKYSTKSAILEIGAFYRGANEDAFRTRAVQNFFNRNGSYMQPAEGNFTIEVRSKKDNQIYEFTFPWIQTKANTPICNNRNINTLSITNATNLIKYSKSVDSNEVINNRNNGKENVTITQIQRNGKNFALIHLNYFIPSAEYDFYNYLEAREKINAEVNFIRKYIRDNKDNIEGVIFDIRGNGGGYGSYPQLLANMFTTQFVSNMLVKPLVSETNKETFYNLEMSRYISRKNTIDPLTSPILDTVYSMEKLINGKFTKELVIKRELLLKEGDRYDGDENDSLPSYYNKETTEILKPILTTKPIAVLTNSNCYSACDIFAALFKDFKIARIYGETAHTGGGGANVIEWNDFLTPVVIDEQGHSTTMIPNAKPLPKGAEIRFAWNKIKRYNNSKYEQYIEGIGILADYVYKPTEEDALNNGSRILNNIMDDMLDPSNSKKFYLNR
ncbi:S41 family peptidase [Pigmentibacter ruber]|uniref:S41 family peptidase n=1 Tax=Pigmentibacter ruber TaxID=2683196 RepID=UPI00131B7490|nr:S41 family peptidase [Pigmentibacter ruber]